MPSPRLQPHRERPLLNRGWTDAAGLMFRFAPRPSSRCRSKSAGPTASAPAGCSGLPALDVRVSYFFDDLPEDMPSDRQAALGNDADDVMTRRETLELVTAFYRIKDEGVRQWAREIIKAVAGPVPGARKRGRPPGSKSKVGPPSPVEA
jgi:hypothetical protein